MTSPNYSNPGDSGGSQPAQVDPLIQGGSGPFICGGPGVVPFRNETANCPKVHTAFGDLVTHVLTEAELAAAGATVGISKEIGALTGTGGAVAPVLQGPSGGWFGSVLDGLNTLLKSLTNPDFWKGAGLVLAAGAAVIVGAVLWLGKGRDVERTAERSAV